MENPCKPPIEEKVYNCPRILEANINSDTQRGEVRQVECGKGLGFFKQKDPIVVEPPVIEEMGPPPYSDLGKKAKDVFNKGYHFGLIKLDVKTKSNSGVEFSTGGSSNQESGKVSGSLETKYKVKDYGLTFTEKWTTDNTLSTEFAVQDQFLPGSKLSACLNFAPQTGQKTGTIKTGYVNNQVNVNVDADITGDGPVTTASAVVGYQGWLAGYQAGFDVNNKKLTKSNFALGFTSGDFTLHSNVELVGEGEEGAEGDDKGKKLGGSIHHQISPKLEAGIMIDWFTGGGEAEGEGKDEDGGKEKEKEKEKKDDGKAEKKDSKAGKDGEDKEGGGGSNPVFAIGAQYQLDADASIRCFVNNDVQIGLGYEQRLRPGILLALSALIDGKNLDQGGGHKVGLALTLEA